MADATAHIYIGSETLDRLLAKWKAQSNERPLRILVGGKTGAGKSALINNLLGEQLCREGFSPSGVTGCVEKVETELNGVSVQIFDTPGLEQIRQRDSKIIAKMSLAVQDKASKELDLFFYCKSITERVTEEDARVLRLLTRSYGSELWKRGVIVLTKANQVNDREKHRYQEIVKQYENDLKTILHKKLKVSEAIVKNIPACTAGYTERIIPCEAEEGDRVSVASGIGRDQQDWKTPLYEAALGRADPKFVPALVDVTVGKAVSMKRAVAAGTVAVVPAAVVGAGVGAGIGLVIPAGGEVVGAAIGAGIGALVGGPPGAITGAAVGGCSRVIKHKFEVWNMRRTQQRRRRDQYESISSQE